MNIEKMREEFEAAACARVLEDDPRCGLTAEEIAESRRGDDYQSSMWSFAWWSWQASRESLVPAWHPMSEDPPFPFTGDIFVAGKVVVGASWCSGYWQSVRRGCLDRDSVSHWKPRNPDVQPPSTQSE